MKKKTILLSILSIIMCLSLTVGGTFALFTSKSEVNVAVTSGTVKVSASITNTEYSFDSRLTEASNCTYEINANGGLDINQMVPGDSIKATLSIANDSDVAIQYRINTAVSGDLADYLVIEKVTKLWTKVDAKANIADETVVITLPYEVEDAKAQGATASVLITVEAVQANAPVANVVDGETTTDTNLTDNKGNRAVAPKGVDMKDGETTLTLKVEEAQSANTGNFSFGDDATVYAYDVKVPEVAEDNDEEIIVTMTAPADLQNVFMYHGGVAMNCVSDVNNVVNHNDFFYDVAGFITFATKTFSNFTFVNVEKLEGTLVYTADELVAALEKGEDVVLASNIKINPANMSNAYGTTGINVKNGQTIDGAGHILDIKGAGGTWDSGINTTGGIIKNITVTGSFRGIFINHNSTHSEKVVLENVIIDGTTYTISCDQGMNQGFEATNCTFNGWTSFAGTLGDATFTDCKFAEGNGYAYCRPYAETVFENCEFEAGYRMDARAKVAFDGGTFGGVAINESNYNDLVVSNAQNVTFVKYIATAQELASALTDGGKYALSNDIVLDAPISIADGVKTTLNMKGFAISYESSVTGKNTYAIDVHGNLTVSNGSLTFKHVGDDMSWNNCTAIFHLDFNGKLTLNNVDVENLGGTSMAYGVDITNVYAKNNSKLTIYNSNLKSTYIAVRVFNNGDGVHNVQINDSKLEGKYAFWVQYYIGDFKDEATTELKVANLNIDIYNDDNIFVGAENVVSAILYGFNEATYFNANGEVIA